MSAPQGYPLPRWGRAALVIVVLGICGGFWLSTTVEPSERGFGSHQALGLPPCSIRIWFGIRCPSCGSTTAFANFVRGRWLTALDNNAAAVGLALLCAALVPWGLCSAATGRMWRINDPLLVLVWTMGVLCVISVTQWGVRGLAHGFQ